MTECEKLEPRWDGPVIIAATGESLTKHVAGICMESGRPIIAIKQACLRLPTADVLYACDEHHWEKYQGYPDFRGERWSTHGSPSHDNKMGIAAKYGLRLVRGTHGPPGTTCKTFSTDPRVIHYGNSAGFQALGFAVHWLRKPGRIVLVGLDMRGGYFFGDHPRGKQMARFNDYLPFFNEVAKQLPEGVEIVLGTPSALTCFPEMSLSEALGR